MTNEEMEETITQEYVNQLLKEIAKRDTVIEKLTSDSKNYHEKYTQYYNRSEEQSKKIISLEKEIKEDPKQKRIDDLQRRLDEITLTAKTYSVGAGAMIRDADTRRKELKLIKTRLETLTTLLESFLTEEKVLHGIREEEKDDSEKRFHTIRQMSRYETDHPDGESDTT